MMTTTDKRERRTRGAAARWPRRLSSSLFGYTLAGLGVLALGLTWCLGLVGCGSVPGSSSSGGIPGTFATRQSPDEVSRLLRNAHYYKLMGRPELALKELEQALQQNPDNLKLINILAQCYEEAGQYETARKIYQDALNRNGPHPALANNLCFTYYLEGRYQEAEACFRQTLARDRNNEAARNNLGLLYCRLGRQDEARRLWQETDGNAAAEYKTRQALAALGMADHAVYAQKAASPPAEVAAAPAAGPPQSPAAVTAPQKIAMRVPTPPAPEAAGPSSDQPDHFVQEQPEGLQITPGLAPRAVPAGSPRPAAARTSRPEPPVPTAAVPTPVAAAPLRAAPPAAVQTSMPPQSLAKVAPPPAPADLEKPDKEAQAKPVLEQAAPAPASKAKARSLPDYLTCAELVGTGIEVRNGTPAPHLAHEVRTMLRQEAFTVVRIGNYRDFGVEKTIIYYRPEAQRVARTLQTDLFPMASLEQTEGLYGKVAVKVLLGRDILENQDLMALLNGEEAPPATATPAADQRLAEPAPVAPPAPARQEPQTAPQEKSAPAPASVAQTRAPAPQAAEPLTAAELEYVPIEVLNGTRTPNLARHTRTLLDLEGFSVARIGNYINFGAKKTIIYYRPEAHRVAQALSQTLLPGASLEPSTQLRQNIAVQILLGADLLERPQVMARLAIEAP